ARCRIERIAEANEQLSFDVLQRNGQRMALNLVVDITQNEVAISVGKADLQAGLDIKAGPPAGILWRGGGRPEIERCPFVKTARCQEIRIALHMAAPID